MKKIRGIMIVIFIALLLNACVQKEVGHTDLEFPDLKWGMTLEETLSAGGIAEEEIIDSKGEYDSIYYVEDYEVFGEKSDGVSFGFVDMGNGKQGLWEVIVRYPDDADMDQVLEKMTKAYGSTVPEIIDYQLFSSFDEQALVSKQYTESEDVKIWAGASIGEAVPNDQEHEYMKRWQEKINPDGNATFQLGLSDKQWEEFSKNAKMVMVLWAKEGQKIIENGNRLLFYAYNHQVFSEITRRIAEQE